MDEELRRLIAASGGLAVQSPLGFSPADGSAVSPPAPPFAQAKRPPSAEEGWFKPPAAEGGQGKAAGQPVPSFAPAQEPFRERFVQTGMPGLGYGRTVSSREDELAAMAEQVTNRTAGNILGTGFGANNQPLGFGAVLAANQAGRGAADDFLRQALAGDQQRFQAGQAEANRQNQAYLGGLENSTRMQLGLSDQANRLQLGELEARSRVDAAREAHSPQAARNAGTVKLMEMLMSGQADPTLLQGASEFLSQLAPGGGPVTIPPSLQSATGRRQARADAGAALGTMTPEGFKPSEEGVTGRSIEDLLGRLAKTDDASLPGLANDIRSGTFGDSQRIIDQLAKTGAVSYFKLMPPTFPAGHPKAGQPILGLTDMPGSLEYSRNEGDTAPLFGLSRSGPNMSLARVMGNVLTSSGVPYNQIKLPNGQIVKIDPSEFRGNAFRDSFYGVDQPREVYEQRAAQSDRLLRALLKLPAVK